jgi:type II secretion system protein I
VTRRRDPRRGLTLLEALVALALVAAGTAAALRLVRTGVDAVAGEGAYTSALFLAMDELARARLDPPPRGDRETAPAGGPRLERHVRATADPSLLEVRVRVTPPGASAGVELVEIVRGPGA